jgi:hypothetical protein
MSQTMKHYKLTFVIFVILGLLVWVGLGRDAHTKAASPKLIRGTKLELVGEHGPLAIYIDNSSTNKIPDYAVFEGNECILRKESTDSNKIVISHCENGFEVLRTTRDKNGRILERKASYDDGSMELKYTYIDKHGDGLWDYFFDYTKHKYYVRSNLCWVLAKPDRK